MQPEPTPDRPDTMLTVNYARRQQVTHHSRPISRCPSNDWIMEDKVHAQDQIHRRTYSPGEDQAHSHQEDSQNVPVLHPDPPHDQNTHTVTSSTPKAQGLKEDHAGTHLAERGHDQKDHIPQVDSPIPDDTEMDSPEQDCPPSPRTQAYNVLIGLKGENDTEADIWRDAELAVRPRQKRPRELDIPSPSETDEYYRLQAEMLRTTLRTYGDVLGNDYDINAGIDGPACEMTSAVLDELYKLIMNK